VRAQIGASATTLNGFAPDRRRVVARTDGAARGVQEKLDGARAMRPASVAVKAPACASVRRVPAPRNPRARAVARPSENLAMRVARSAPMRQFEHAADAQIAIFKSTFAR
jgi:hypothetical protein